MLHLGSIGRTSIDVDASFLILVLFFTVSMYDPATGWRMAMLWILIIFISVLFHELAHAAAIAMLGHGGSSIVLGGIGGVTINTRRSRPWHEVVISFAGPLASFVLALICLLLALGVPAVGRDPMLREMIPNMIKANLFWAILNLIPVPPLDGGHLVRNFLRMFLRERSAFVIAVWVAIVAGVAAIIWGFRNDAYLLSIFMAWYVWMNWQQWQYFRTNGHPGE